jgi:hypothetical protein
MTESKAKPQLSVRLGPGVLEKLEKAVERQRAAGDPGANRNAIIEEAVSAHLGMLRGGVLFPTEEERGLVEALRKLLVKNADAVEAIHVLAYECLRSPGMAVAVTQIADGLETVRISAARKAEGLSELPEPRPPETSPSGPERRRPTRKTRKETE